MDFPLVLRLRLLILLRLHRVGFPTYRIFPAPNIGWILMDFSREFPMPLAVILFSMPYGASAFFLDPFDSARYLLFVCDASFPP